MHPSSMRNCQAFFECYRKPFDAAQHVKVVEIGSLDINGSIRSTCPLHYEYTGVDFAPGKGVDIVLQDPYTLPLPSESADYVLSTSCFEHSEMFWLLFLEILRLLKPNGLFYLCVPSNGRFHQHPVDCWRFYPDSGKALVTWAKRNGLSPALLESYTSPQVDDEWNDFVAVFVKNEQFAREYPNRILNRIKEFFNGVMLNKNEVINPALFSEDQRKLLLINQIIQNKVRTK